MIPTPNKDKRPGEDSGEVSGSFPAPEHATLGRYQILRELGRGGFGVVFLAYDPKIGRQVAIKTIPTGDLKRSSDGDQLCERLNREAHLAGVLSHPGIATVYELAEDRDMTYIVMQYIGGPTLGKLIAAGGLSGNEFLNLLRQTAVALDFAHSKGIVHRDIKPANIMLDECGTVKITDFGIAKMIGAATQTQTTTSGTLAYMAPEQILNEDVTGRADQFALAVIAYEILTGRRPFRGDSQASVMHQILNTDPLGANLMAPLLPEAMRPILQKALAKDPANRYESCAAFVMQLRQAFQGNERDLAPTIRLADTQSPSEPKSSSSRTIPTSSILAARLRRPGWKAAVILGGLAAALYFFGPFRKTTADRHALPRLAFSSLATVSGPIAFPASSPAKPWLAYARKSDHWNILLQSFRPADSSQPNRSTLTGDQTIETTQPAFSPDGLSLAFRSGRDNGGIFVVNLAAGEGESMKKVADFGFNPTWSPDGKSICIAQEGIARPEDRLTKKGQLWVVDLASGKRNMIYAGDAVQPSWSPHGQRIAFWFVRDGGMRDIATIPAAGGAPVRVTNDPHMDWNPTWSPDGRYLFFSSDRGEGMRLWRVAIDERSGEIRSNYEPLGEPGQDNSAVTFSEGGKEFTYLERKFTALISRVDFDPMTGVAGLPTPIPHGAEGNRPEPSPDGRQVAFSSAAGKREDLFVMGLDGSGRRALLGDMAVDRGPRWSPDGRRIAFFSNRSGEWQIWSMGLDFSAPVQVTHRAGALYPVWAPDGSRLVYTVRGDDPSQMRSFITTLAGATKEEIELPGPGDPLESFTPWSWSPDGTMLTGYRQRRDGVAAGITVYNLNEKSYRRITVFGSDPVWLHKSPRLLFHSDGKIYLADIRDPGNSKPVLSVAPDEVARRGFGVSRDDRTIYFSLEKTESQVRMGRFE